MVKTTTTESGTEARIKFTGAVRSMFDGWAGAAYSGDRLAVEVSERFSTVLAVRSEEEIEAVERVLFEVEKRENLKSSQRSALRRVRGKLTEAKAELWLSENRVEEPTPEEVLDALDSEGEVEEPEPEPEPEETVEEISEFEEPSLPSFEEFMSERLSEEVGEGEPITDGGTFERVEETVLSEVDEFEETVRERASEPLPFDALSEAFERLSRTSPGATIEREGEEVDVRILALRESSRDMPVSHAHEIVDSGIRRVARYSALDRNLSGLLGETPEGRVVELKYRDGTLLAEPVRFEGPAVEPSTDGGEVSEFRSAGDLMTDGGTVEPVETEIYMFRSREGLFCWVFDSTPEEESLVEDHVEQIEGAVFSSLDETILRDCERYLIPEHERSGLSIRPPRVAVAQLTEEGVEEIDVSLTERELHSSTSRDGEPLTDGGIIVAGDGGEVIKSEESREGAMSDFRDRLTGEEIDMIEGLSSGSLTESQAIAFALRDVFGRSRSEVAEIMGTSVSSVDTHRTRGAAKVEESRRTVEALDSESEPELMTDGGREERRSVAPTPQDRSRLVDSLADLTYDALEFGEVSREEALSALVEVTEEIERDIPSLDRFTEEGHSRDGEGGTRPVPPGVGSVEEVEEFEGIVVDDSGPVILDDGSETLSVGLEGFSDLSIGDALRVEGSVHSTDSTITRIEYDPISVETEAPEESGIYVWDHSVERVRASGFDSLEAARSWIAVHGEEVDHYSDGPRTGLEPVDSRPL